eukprot:6876567-Prymnesium_polylepis.1
MTAFAAVMVFVVLYAAFQAIRTDGLVNTLRVRETGAPPNMSIDHGHIWMLFLSHVWATGQDQAATIKRQLQRMLSGVSIFLDVDDLQSIDLLEDYVEQSACMLLFLSRGYLLSRNCVREVDAAVDFDKPHILVWEANADRGGAPLETLIQECPPELREPLFEGKPVIQWHRIADFQLISLKLIAEGLLLASPAYMKLESLSLHIKGELLDQDLLMALGTCILISDANVGGLEAA